MVSDHCDWPGLLSTIEATGCESVGVTHGYCEPVVRYLTERGMAADVVPTRYVGEADGSDADGEPSGEPGCRARPTRPLTVRAEGEPPSRAGVEEDTGSAEPRPPRGSRAHARVR